MCCCLYVSVETSRNSITKINNTIKAPEQQQQQQVGQ